MKFLICVDLEGCACVVGQPGKSLSQSSDYQFACKEAVLETNAAISALFDSGATEVIVWDAHGRSTNLSYFDLDPRCKIITGLGYSHRLFFVDETYSGVLFIGYHSRDNVRNAILCHSYKSAEYQWIKINGQEVGELEIDASICGKAGVPVIFVSSDDTGCSQIKEVAPWVKTVATKQSLGHNLSLSKHPLQVKEEIYHAVCSAVSDLSQMSCYALQEPATVEIRYTNVEDAQHADFFSGDGVVREGDDAYSKIYTANNISHFINWIIS